MHAGNRESLNRFFLVLLYLSLTFAAFAELTKEKDKEERERDPMRR